MRTAITICLVPEAREGPFVFHDGLADGCARAAKHGFDGVEIFPPAAAAISVVDLKKLLRRHELQVAAFGTGAGWLRERLTLTSPHKATRQKAVRFIQEMLELGGKFGAAVIIGSMQGRVEPEVERAVALDWLHDGLASLADIAAQHSVTLLYEPLNRYETNLFNRLADTAQWLQTRELVGVKILADMFHMNIEEANSALAIHSAKSLIGHVHFADSNRRAMGFGHTKFKTLVSALHKIGYDGYLSAEIFPWPDSSAAAKQTMTALRQVL
ncbi:MAG: sugar phosphate isomerase/epimerase family protein [Pirellulales bacterium]|nr:sugar phosphate isomerase/epimerase family protein [Pirellulales bacterium]